MGIASLSAIHMLNLGQCTVAVQQRVEVGGDGIDRIEGMERNWVEIGSVLHLSQRNIIGS